MTASSRPQSTMIDCSWIKAAHLSRESEAKGSWLSTSKELEPIALDGRLSFGQQDARAAKPLRPMPSRTAWTYGRKRSLSGRAERGGMRRACRTQNQRGALDVEERRFVERVAPVPAEVQRELNAGGRHFFANRKAASVRLEFSPKAAAQDRCSRMIERALPSC